MLDVGSPPTKTSPPSGFSRSPARCKSVDLPVPDGATSATISPGETLRSAPRKISRKPSPCGYRRSTRERRRAGWSDAAIRLSVPERLDGIEPRRAPGRVESGEQRQQNGHANNRYDLGRI